MGEGNVDLLPSPWAELPQAGERGWPENREVAGQGVAAGCWVPAAAQGFLLLQISISLTSLSLSQPNVTNLPLRLDGMPRSASWSQKKKSRLQMKDIWLHSEIKQDFPMLICVIFP